MDWTSLLNAVPETLKSLFGLIDKVVPDREKADEMKLQLFQLVQGQSAAHWLPANAFTVVMVCNYGMIMFLTVTGRNVPEWSLWVFGAWVLGPLLNTLSRETIAKLGEIVKSWKTKKEE
jgi:hypothetical protein